MKIALITGRLAEPIIREIVRNFRDDRISIDIVALPIDVIGAVKTTMIARIIKKHKEIIARLKNTDLIIVPGTVRGSCSEIENLLGKPTYKGTTEPEAIIDMLEFLGKGGELSREKPADNIIGSTALSRLLELIKKTASEHDYVFDIGRLRVPSSPPPFIIAAETPPRVKPEQLEQMATYYEEEGADIVVVGVPLGESLDESYKRIKAVERGINKAVLGIDSASPQTIKKGLERGAEIAFSLSLKNMDKFVNYRNKAFVIIPYPPHIKNKSRVLVRTVERAKKMGYRKLIIDPIVSPPGRGLRESLKNYLRIKRIFPENPLLLGLSNITEMIDADSIGVNALAVQLAGELGISIILTTEDSYKTRNSVIETRIASFMTTASIKWRKPPLNLGVDLLVLKEKREPVDSLPQGVGEVKMIKVEEDAKVKLDRWGYVTIYVDYRNRIIYACIHTYKEKDKVKCYYSNNARALYKRVVQDYPFSPQHAAYLGYELSKAEMAAILGKKYVQDSSLMEHPTIRYSKIIKEYISIR